ncbi:MAG: Gfo/Idh/MocA family oxidoreductase, partial [Planctomycetales bacterium]|nr:Gfo/Idh/MocA family oxidoreductase [Planctomycetales bacterium]
MPGPINRRSFVQAGTLASAVGFFSSVSAQDSPSGSSSPNSRLVVGVMGLSRGQSLAESFAAEENVEVRYLCDVDSQRIDSCSAKLSEQYQIKPKGVGDFRKILDDPEVDALVCAAPNHWHAPASILACSAEKHVYVEKPCSHNPWEGETMVKAARKRNRCVQMGSQRRSSPGWIEAIAQLRSGAIGDVYLARAFYSSLRGSIGKGTKAAVPKHLDFELWQGPAPRTDYVSNLVHYNWHWRWQWGNGELGNNGVHTLDLCRWGLEVDYPTKVTSSGGRYCYDDDQETPDTHTVCFEFPGGKAATWHGLSCNRHDSDDFVLFYGKEGAMEVDSAGGFKIFDKSNKLVRESA